MSKPDDVILERSLSSDGTNETKSNLLAKDLITLVEISSKRGILQILGSTFRFVFLQSSAKAQAEVSISPD